MPLITEYLRELRNQIDELPLNTGQLFNLQTNYEVFLEVYERTWGGDDVCRLLVQLAWAYMDFNDYTALYLELEDPPFPRGVIKDLVRFEAAELMVLPDLFLSTAYERSEAIRLQYGNHDELPVILFRQFMDHGRDYHLYYGQQEFYNFEFIEEAIKFHQERFFNGQIGAEPLAIEEIPSLGQILVRVGEDGETIAENVKLARSWLYKVRFPPYFARNVLNVARESEMRGGIVER
ncbi:hypothetical protein AAF712_008965 [Marasmius tenuissimus]|uniref:Uncharacterized protein n=1 Tax=Marasmius tenuissimus TaxID=585030 RepID=A0ABR2ZS08_9AGAR